MSGILCVTSATRAPRPVGGTAVENGTSVLWSSLSGLLWAAGVRMMWK